MLELRPVSSDIIGCFGQPEALDRVDGNGWSIRVAPDERLLLGQGERLADLQTQLAALDPFSIVLNLSSAFAIWSLGGTDRGEAFRRLCAIRLPDAPGIAQGLFAQVPAKVMVRKDDLLVVYPRVVSHHVRARVLAACADLDPVELAAAPRAA